MAAIAFLTFGLLVIIMLLSFLQLWRVHRRGRMREKRIDDALLRHARRDDGRIDD